MPHRMLVGEGTSAWGQVLPVIARPVQFHEPRSSQLLNGEIDAVRQHVLLLR
jgi:hypothetical protein